MSDGIWYKGKLIGSIHYSVYKEGTVSREKDLFIRMNNISVLEILLRLGPRSKLRVGGKTKAYELTYEQFRREWLEEVRDIRMEANKFNSKPVSDKPNKKRAKK